MEVEEARAMEEDSFDSYLTIASMGVDDDGLQELFSSLASNLASGVPSQKEDALSPEDAAWVESCLVKDFGNSNDNWDDVKEALFSIISSQVPSPTFEVSDETLEVNNNCVVNDDGRSNVALLLDSARDHISPNPVYVEENGDEEAKVATFLRDHLVYNHINLEENEGGEANVAPASMEDSESPENIFRVWDLGTQFEVDELTKQLAKAHEEGSICNDLGGAASNEEIFDDLLVGIADLSLDPRT